MWFFNLRDESNLQNATKARRHEENKQTAFGIGYEGNSIFGLASFMIFLVSSCLGG